VGVHRARNVAGPSRTKFVPVAISLPKRVRANLKNSLKRLEILKRQDFSKAPNCPQKVVLLLILAAGVIAVLNSARSC